VGLQLKLLERRTRTALTWRGWVVALAIALGLLTLAGRSLPSFLAPEQRVDAQVLVVEGWLPDFALQRALDEFRRGGYRQLWVTGSPIERGSAFARFDSYAELGAATLVHLGAPAEVTHAAPAGNVPRDRTYAAGAALARALSRQPDFDGRLNVMTMGAHSRRTRLLFRMAMPESWRVGVIPVTDPAYDPRHWWRTSAGFRDVTGEAIAWLYARWLFRPAEPDAQPRAPR
jgi:hypothetical protein